MLNKACGQVLVEYSIGLLGENRVDPVGAGEHGGAVWRDENREGNKCARAKIGFGCREDAGKLAEDVSKVFDDRRGPARTAEVERNVAQM